ncbi:MAG: cystathionine beta-lyase [Burkholderiales bacterium]|jgi:cystathionine beta-lyase|nr:cystathionine beta-lyase [Burkholderiales bacterium]
MKPDTVLVHAGRDPGRFGGLVNAPVSRASTILHADMATYRLAQADKHGRPYYGRFGTATHRMLEEACTQLDDGHGTVLFPSGLAACTGALNAVVRPGSHLLMVDSVYGPVRDYCDTVLAERGVQTEYYPPSLGADIATRLRPDTSAVYCESPGSLTFEIQDLPAIAEAAHRAGAAVLADNTWATPFFCQPLALGADIAVQAATKYLVGHSDAMLGVAVANERCYLPLRTAAARQGNSVSADDCTLALRGLRTLGVRLRQHQASALALARWLQGRPEVLRVDHPALPDDPGHALWRRDFRGASGLFGFELQPVPEAAVDDFIDGLALFGIGASWGGFESLILPSHPKRSCTGGAHPAGVLLRLHIGLEDVDDLQADLAAGLDRHIAPRLLPPRVAAPPLVKHS